ncbi:MAG: glycerol-3-phosphate dehydrogenase/oxidase [Thermodesulfobacteriota bacterium]|nr:glycerol-3-phosphate dehydrogenase/oxidase [Thermodesulfobacteriota bacterium]
MKLEDIKKNWDLIVIGGGITGAGVFREAVHMGLDVLLLERKDFAWGTSSRSSKLIHGGLRYLKEKRFLLTRASVNEREHLLHSAPGLVESLGFLMPVYENQKPGKKMLSVGLSVYDMIAGEKQHQYYEAEKFSSLIPQIRQEALLGGFLFYDAQVDDARLVLRLINEAVESGGTALNYTSAIKINRNVNGEVVGITARDTETLNVKNLSTPAVINATGSWAEELHPSPESKLHLRPLRGSHLLFPGSLLDLSHAVSFVHPADNRPVFIVPWEGAILLGTTDVDHYDDLSKEPTISKEEIDYLMDAFTAMFPSVDISLKDCISTFAGVRPILSRGNLSPSEESREHMIWKDKGLVTITGGKLTTFRRSAQEALKAAKPFFGPGQMNGPNAPELSRVPDRPEMDYGLSLTHWHRLYGRYGKKAEELVGSASPEDLSNISGTQTLWAEVPFAAEHEQVKHLDDLLLRRLRIGLLTPQGGKSYLKRIRRLCKNSLPWNHKRWRKEIKIYLEKWERCYAPVPTEAAPPDEPRPLFINKFKAVFKKIVKRLGQID